MTRAHSSAQDGVVIPTQGQPTSNARLLAELQGLTLAIRMFGLDGIRDGHVRFPRAAKANAEGAE